MALAAVAAGVGAVAKGVSAIGGFIGKRKKAKSLLADARVENAVGAAQSADLLREGRRSEAAGAVAAGASGFTVEGSAVDVLANLAQESSASSRRAIFNASRRADRLKKESKEQRRAATFGLVGGLVNAGATAAGGFA